MYTCTFQDPSFILLLGLVYSQMIYNSHLPDCRVFSATSLSIKEYTLILIVSLCISLRELNNFCEFVLWNTDLELTEGKESKSMKETRFLVWSFSSIKHSLGRKDWAEIIRATKAFSIVRIEKWAKTTNSSWGVLKSPFPAVLHGTSSRCRKVTWV